MAMRLALATAIARHFGFLLSPGDVAAVARSAGAAAAPEERQESAWLDQLSAREHAIINGALEPYVNYFNGGGELEPIVWEPDLFYTNESTADGSYRPASGPIDITGRARFLIFGPYINLPPGAWSATAVIGFSAETAGLSFVIEIAAGHSSPTPACSRPANRSSKSTCSSRLPIPSCSRSKSALSASAPLWTGE